MDTTTARVGGQDAQFSELGEHMRCEECRKLLIQGGRWHASMREAYMVLEGYFAGCICMQDKVPQLPQHPYSFTKRPCRGSRWMPRKEHLFGWLAVWHCMRLLGIRSRSPDIIYSSRTRPIFAVRQP